MDLGLFFRGTKFGRNKEQRRQAEKDSKQKEIRLSVVRSLRTHCERNKEANKRNE